MAPPGAWVPGMNDRGGLSLNRFRRRLPAGVTIVISILGAIALAQDQCVGDPAPTAGGVAQVERAFRERRSVWVEIEGQVVRTLSDDNEGSRHQRFIIELDNGQTLLVSHNIDLAPRVPVGVNDRVTVRGEYVWNERGGLMHWTHHDPRGDRVGGWIALRGETYR